MPNGNPKSSAKKSPAYIVALGDVSASIFTEHRVSEDGKRDWKSYSVSLRRSYVDSTKQRVYANTLFERDLLDASEALVKANHWIETDRSESAKAIAQEEAEANGES